MYGCWPVDSICFATSGSNSIASQTPYFRLSRVSRAINKLRTYGTPSTFIRVFQAIELGWQQRRHLLFTRNQRLSVTTHEFFQVYSLDSQSAPLHATLATVLNWIIPNEEITLFSPSLDEFTELPVKRHDRQHFCTS